MVESLVRLWSPVILLGGGESSEWYGDLTEVFDEATIKFGEPEEFLKLFSGVGGRPVLDCFGFHGVCTHRSILQNEAQE